MISGLLRGTCAIVTGASRGIGRNIAVELAAEGCNVVIAARSEVESDPRLPGTINTAAEECRAFGVEALAVPCDVTRDDHLANLVEQARTAFGRVDILVNNAGLSFPGRFLDVSEKRWDLVWRLNVRGTQIATRLVLPLMIDQGGGTIVNISSRGADGTGANGSAYAVTKQAVRKLAEAVAAEYSAEGVRSFSLSPSRVVSTPGHRYIRGANAVPHDLAEPDHVMGRAVVWLATSEDALARNGEHFYSIPLVAEYMREDTTWDGLRKLREGRATATPSPGPPSPALRAAAREGGALAGGSSQLRPTPEPVEGRQRKQIDESTPLPRSGSERRRRGAGGWGR
jgi:NAD(P)-dependent dehydrogenase (short-subunit alcohol dehydrogenase family)